MENMGLISCLLFTFAWNSLSTLNTHSHSFVQPVRQTTRTCIHHTDSICREPEKKLKKNHRFFFSLISSLHPFVLVLSLLSSIITRRDKKNYSYGKGAAWHIGYTLLYLSRVTGTLFKFIIC